MTSPTYTIGHRYEGGLPVAHLDLYRFEQVSPSDWGTLEPYFDGTVVFVEWPEAAVGWIERPPPSGSPTSIRNGGDPAGERSSRDLGANLSRMSGGLLLASTRRPASPRLRSCRTESCSASADHTPPAFSPTPTIC